MTELAKDWLRWEGGGLLWTQKWILKIHKRREYSDRLNKYGCLKKHHGLSWLNFVLADLGHTISKWKQFYMPGTLIYLISSYEKGLKLATMADISSFESGWAVLPSLYREWLFFLCYVILSKYWSVYFLDSGGRKRKSPKDIIGILRNGGLHPQYENCWIQLHARSWILRHVRRGKKRKKYILLWSVPESKYW